MKSKLSILFVDDDEAMHKSLCKTLQSYREHWDMTFVSSSLSAVDLLEVQGFDVVVANMVLSELDGAGLMAIVEKRHPESIRILISEQDVPAEGVIRAVGATHQYLSKPIVAGELIDTLERTYNLHNALQSKNLRQQISRLRTLPTPPDLFLRITTEIQKEQPSLRVIAGMISEDVAMTAEVLRITNSGYFALETQVHDVFQAIRLLGLETVHALVCAAGIFRQFDFSPDMADFLGDLDVHCLLVATQARQIAQRLQLREALQDQAFCAGMLSCVGTLVLMDVYPDKMRSLMSRALLGENWTTVERELFGASQAEVGAYLLGLWGFTDVVVEAVLYHDRPSDCSYQDHSALTCVHLARAVGADLEINGSCIHPIQLDDAYLGALQLPPELSSGGLEL